MSDPKQALYAGDYFDYLHDRGVVRKFIRRLYLRDIRQYCLGPTLDFGCGVGELLRILPPGSIGLEVNPVAVAYCRAQGLEVSLYDPEQDGYRLQQVPEQVYSTFTMNHVLEHIDSAGEAAHILFSSCRRLGIRRLVLTVPGSKGYQSDATHRTFIDQAYLEKTGVLDHPDYQLVKAKYFPFNTSWMGRYFTHNELRLIFDARHG